MLLLLLQACWLFEIKLRFKPGGGKYCIFSESVWSQVCGLPWRVAKAVASARESSEATKAICISVWRESGQQRDWSCRHDRKQESLCLVNIKYSFPDLWTSCLFKYYVSCTYLWIQLTPVLLWAYVAVRKITSACDCRQDGVLQSDFFFFPFPISHQKSWCWSCHRLCSAKWVLLQN